MTIKKIKSAEFHLGDRLNGRKPNASYGVFDNSVQVGFATSGRNGNWDAYAMDGKSRLNSYTCSSLAQLKVTLAAK
jgi:hypothetical protein